MPTVDELAPAPAATDSDTLAASQAGILRRVTRAQLLAGTQPQITLPSGMLLGRQSDAIGGPEPVVLGRGLTMNGGVLSTVEPPLSLTGQDLSGCLVVPDGATTQRTLAALLAAAVTPESFGAVGDGVTDDTAALTAALATMRPVQLGPRVYATKGQWTIPLAATLLGTPGQTVVRRVGQVSGGAWISIQGRSFTADGVDFDANGSAMPGETWAVLVTATCTRIRFRGCRFRNGGGPTLGNGLTVAASDPATSDHVIDDCEATGNAAHGIWLQAVDGARLTGNRAHDNGGYGLCADFNDASFAQAVRLAAIQGNACWSNVRGISVGNFNATNLQPPSWGNSHPDAVGVVVSGNVCHDNAVYGIAVSGRSLLVEANLLSGNGSTANGGAGILANCAYSRIAGNTVTGAAQFGIDCGGSIVLDVAGNHVAGAAVGINPGGSQNVRVGYNVLQDNGWAILAYNVETDGVGNNFGLTTSGLMLTDNVIGLANSSSGGIWLADAPQQVLVARNSFTGGSGSSINQCLYAHTDSAVVEGNRWNNTVRLFANPTAIGGRQTITLPDIADEVMLSAVSSGVQSIQTARQLAVAGQIGFVRVTAGGSGYSRATVTISGDGSGATAIAYVANGVLIGVALTSPGAGYTAGVATIAGDGSGGAAVAIVGLPVLEGRQIRVACNTAVSFARAGSIPFQENWTGGPLIVPANATVRFTGTFGSWRADGATLAEYVGPPGDGSLVLRTTGGQDLFLRPSAGGRLRVTSESDPAGYVAATGHGSPDGLVTAPPGSDYRNLDGGAGQTLWIKRTGIDAHGWFAIA